MAKITMDMIKELRERTSAGVVDCKKVLSDTDGDVEKAIEELQKRGIAKAAKKQGRIAAEGKVGIYVTDDGKVGALAEVNCETDFVDKGEKFIELYENVAKQVALSKSDSLEALNAAKYIGDESLTVEQTITNFTAATGEKTTLRRITCYATDAGRIGSYIHDGGRICVLVDIKTGDADLASSDDFAQMADDIAMHVAAMNPSYVRADEIPTEDVAKQQEIFTALVIEEGKPEAIAPKIVDGKLAKWKKENCLVDQVFVKDSDITITALLAKFGEDVSVAKFARFEVGEGMQKRVNDLAAEVAEMTS
jgi:elongation factor Ts